MPASADSPGGLAGPALALRPSARRPPAGPGQRAGRGNSHRRRAWPRDARFTSKRRPLLRKTRENRGQAPALTVAASLARGLLARLRAIRRPVRAAGRRRSRCEGLRELPPQDPPPLPVPPPTRRRTRRRTAVNRVRRPAVPAVAAVPGNSRGKLPGGQGRASGFTGKHLMTGKENIVPNGFSLHPVKSLPDTKNLPVTLLPGGRVVSRPSRPGEVARAPADRPGKRDPALPGRRTPPNGGRYSSKPGASPGAEARSREDGRPEITPVPPMPF